jgi:His-Xaa-Ser system protein HxsD
MSTPVPGFPSDRATAELVDGSARITLDESVYPLDAVYSAAYVFIDRCYVLIDRADEGRLRVTLADKDGEGGDEVLRAMLGEFANELLSAAWRQQIARDNRSVIEATTMQAIAGAMGPPSLDELADFDFTEEPFEDPLGISMSWEEKYAKKKKGEGE